MCSVSFSHAPTIAATREGITSEEAKGAVRSKSMCTPHVIGTWLLPVIMLLIACSGAPGPSPPVSALPTPPREDLPTEPPPATIPPGFVFPVPAPLTEGNADIYAQRALFDRTGSLCFTHMDVDGEYAGDFEAMAAKLGGDEGLLEDGRSYVGPLEEALAALDLEPTGIVIGTIAYGIGLVTESRAMPQLPVGTVWTPKLRRFELADGRTGWTLSGPWIAVVDRPCSVLPTTPD